MSTPSTCQLIAHREQFACLNNAEIPQAKRICQIDSLKVRLAINLKLAQREAPHSTIAITWLPAINLRLQYLWWSFTDRKHCWVGIMETQHRLLRKVHAKQLPCGGRPWYWLPPLMLTCGIHWLKERFDWRAIVASISLTSHYGLLAWAIWMGCRTTSSIFHCDSRSDDGFIN